jgi:glycosyltransferase involved in cell wall biosynthesis
MRVLIATVQVPFIHGGAEILAEDLRRALVRAGHSAEIAAVPFKSYPPEKTLDHMLACRLLDLTESCGVSIDRVIGLKFPAYLVEHPHKTLWLLHQHRSAYDLWDNEHADFPLQGVGRQVRNAIDHADRTAISKARGVFTISQNVSRRLKNFCGLDSTALYPPPSAPEEFFCNGVEDYYFFPSRLTRIKRQSLVVEALAQTRENVRVLFAGATDDPAYVDDLKQMVDDLGVGDRVKWLGSVSSTELRRLYASALGVIFVPLDEDYGYVTLEAMLSSKPVITTNDSGGPLEFVQQDVTGLISQPDPEALAESLDKIWRDRSLARALGRAGREHYNCLQINWENVIAQLLA